MLDNVFYNRKILLHFCRTKLIEKKIIFQIKYWILLHWKNSENSSNIELENANVFFRHWTDEDWESASEEEDDDDEDGEWIDIHHSSDDEDQVCYEVGSLYLRGG